MEATSTPRPHAFRAPRPRRWLAALSDERLVELVRGGDTIAFEVLYDRHTGGILGFCRHMLGSVADAEDAVQHTFIAAHSDIQRHGDRDLHVKAWLYTIARNRCFSMLRARREQPAEDEIDLVTDSVQHDIQQREDLRALLADVNRLPRDQREALVLAEVGDLSHEDIGAVIGCETNRVKSLVFQARTALIDRRIARETPCDQIREELATLRGGALRRSYLKHHLDDCPGCSEFREQVRRQRAMLAVALPVVPSAALKANVLGGAGLSAGVGLGVATQAGVVAKLGIAALLAAGAGGGVAAATGHGIPFLHHAHSAAVKRSTAAPAWPAGHAAAAPSKAPHATPAPTRATPAPTRATPAPTRATPAPTRATINSPKPTTTHMRSVSGTTHGFTPAQHGSSGAAARQRAATRGNGKHLGITKTHHTPTRAHGAPVAKTKAPHLKHVAAPRAHSHASPNGVTHRTTPVPKAHAPKPAPEPAPTKTHPTPAPQGNANGQAQQTSTTPAPQPGGKAQGKTGGNSSAAG